MVVKSFRERAKELERCPFPPMSVNGKYGNEFEQWLRKKPNREKEIENREMEENKMSNQQPVAIIHGFKGFDKDLKCRGHQYKVGEVYEEKNAVACRSGFHFCESPIDVFSYYPPRTSRYARVDGGKKIDRDGLDSKVACSAILIGQELSFKEMISESVNYALNKAVSTKKTDYSNALFGINTADYGKAVVLSIGSVAAVSGVGAVAETTRGRSISASTGKGSLAQTREPESVAATSGPSSVAYTADMKSIAANTAPVSIASSNGVRSIAAQIGDSGGALTSKRESVAVAAGWSGYASAEGIKSVALASGRSSRCSVEGEQSIAVSASQDGAAKGALGCWIVLTEWAGLGDAATLKQVKAFQVDGTKIKAHTYYTLKSGKAVLFK